MAIGNLESSGFISFLPYDKDPLIEYYTTTEENEIILFLDFKEDNIQRYLNALIIENINDSNMYVRILPSNYCLVIPSGESRTYDNTKTNGIQIMGQSGQKLRWSGCFF